MTDSNLLHPSIDKTTAYTIADVGTGTGIWLEDLAASLNSVPLQDEGKTREYFGFDISPKQFPAVSKHDVKYGLHDATQRFPPEYRGRFDVVHVRLLVVAVKEREIAGAVKNLIELLKPGGYLQWEEFNHSKHTCVPHSSRYLSHLAFYIDYADEVGFSNDMPAHLKKVFHEVGLNDIQASESSLIRTIGKNGFTENDAKNWWISLMKGVLPVVLKGRGRDAKDLDKIMAEIEEDFKSGVVPDSTFEVVLGRKPA